MGFWSRLLGLSSKESKDTAKDDIHGCIECNNLLFLYDLYNAEYVCQKCGWKDNKKPNGNVKITIKDKTKNTNMRTKFDQIMTNQILMKYNDRINYNTSISEGSIKNEEYILTQIEAIVMLASMNDAGRTEECFNKMFSKISLDQIIFVKNEALKRANALGGRFQHMKSLIQDSFDMALPK